MSWSMPRTETGEVGPEHPGARAVVSWHDAPPSRDRTGAVRHARVPASAATDAAGSGAGNGEAVPAARDGERRAPGGPGGDPRDRRREWLDGARDPADG